MRVPLPSCGHDESRYCADQVRQMGIQVGDIIVGLERYSGPGWSEARLELVALTEQTAVWKQEARSSREPAWRRRSESANWDLQHRDWFRLEPYFQPDTKA